MNKRGYSLVEIAISLAVLGLLLGASLVPLRLRFDAENRQETSEILDSAMKAVAGYASTHRTVERRVVDNDGFTRRLPNGRPYLPCPDVTGDGLENRTAISHPQATPINITSTVMMQQGVCQEQKGLLPWRTLGLPDQVDSWGRKLGYWVDIAFSSEIMGFDETFNADVFERRQRTSLGGYSLRASRDVVGAVVCSELYKTGLSSPPPGGPGCPNQAMSGVVYPKGSNVLSGVVVYGAPVELPGGHEVPAYTTIDGSGAVEGIASGAAYVIFSHGKNGRGGINAVNRCLPPPPDADNLAERANAFYRTGHPFLDPMGDFRCSDFITDMNIELAENLFVSAPVAQAFRDDDLAEAYDDMVVWVSPNLLFGLLGANDRRRITRLEFLK